MSLQCIDRWTYTYSTEAYTGTTTAIITENQRIITYMMNTLIYRIL